MAKRWRRSFKRSSGVIRTFTILLSALCLLHIYQAYTVSQQKLLLAKQRRHKLFLWEEKQEKKDAVKVKEDSKVADRKESVVHNHTCLQPDGLVFVKTHKTASTTVTNIILRYAEKRHLTVGLPPDRRWELGGYPATLKPSIIDPQLKTYNVLCHHMRFDVNQVRKIVPENSIYVTILREPSDCFESGFAFFRDWPFPAWFEDSTDPRALEKFLKTPEFYYNPETPWHFRARNYMSFDLGLDITRQDNRYVKSMIAKLDKTFNLVMITERLDESLILLKDYLCMESYNEILYIRLKVRQLAVRREVTSRMREQIRSWNNLDTKLYDFFLERLNQRIEEYGQDRMKRDLEHFQGLVEATKEKCVDEYDMDDLKPWISRIRLREDADEDCDKLTWGEVKFGDHIRKFQKSYSKADIRKQLSHGELTQLLREAQVEIIGEEGLRKSA